MTAALQELGFPEYIPACQDSADEYKKQQAVSIKSGLVHGFELTLWQNRVKKQSTLEQSGLSEEELLRQQQELFKSATDKFNSGPADST